MQQLVVFLTNSFGDRLAFVGLQGSYMRGEATEESDIDPMVVIDCLCIDDLNVYKQIISKMEQPEKSCGFMCGRQDLLRWNPLEICHLLHTTKSYFGCLSELVPQSTDADVRNFVKLSVNNLYHEITHRYIHASFEVNSSRITGSYKSVFFILQNVHYLDTGRFITSKAELLNELNGKDAEIMATAIALQAGDSYEFSQLFAQLYNWCNHILERI